MIRTILAYVVGLALFLSGAAGVLWAQGPSERSAAVDGKVFKPDAYQALYDELRRAYPQTPENEAVAYVFWAYEDLKKHFSRVILYDVLKGIVEFSRLTGRLEEGASMEKPQSLQEMISLYLVMKEGDARNQQPAAK